MGKAKRIVVPDSSITQETSEGVNVYKALSQELSISINHIDKHVTQEEMECVAYDLRRRMPQSILDTKCKLASFGFVVAEFTADQIDYDEIQNLTTRFPYAVEEFYWVEEAFWLISLLSVKWQVCNAKAFQYRDNIERSISNQLRFGMSQKPYVLTTISNAFQTAFEDEKQSSNPLKFHAQDCINSLQHVLRMIYKLNHSVDFSTYESLRQLLGLTTIYRPIDPSQPSEIESQEIEKVDPKVIDSNLRHVGWHRFILKNWCSCFQQNYHRINRKLKEAISDFDFAYRQFEYQFFEQVEFKITTSGTPMESLETERAFEFSFGDVLVTDLTTKDLDSYVRT